MAVDAVSTDTIWDFAQATYACPGVEEACLGLQDRLGADVNVIIFCLWLAARRGEARSVLTIISQAIQISRQWQGGVISPLRASRRAVKEIPGATTYASPMFLLRDSLKRAELDAERLELSALAALEATGPSSDRFGCDARRAAEGNLQVYFSAAALTLDPLGDEQVARILQAVFPS